MKRIDRHTVLHVDDHEPMRYARTRVLRRAGFRVLEAATGVDALRIVAESLPDIVVLDVNLPDMSGFEVFRRLQADSSTATVPVLYISACVRDGRSKASALDGGAEAFLTEPVEPEVLGATVRALIRNRQSEAVLRRSYEAEQQARREAEALADRIGRLHSIAEALVESATTEQVLDVIVDRVMAATGAEIGVVALFDPARNQLVVERAVGTSRDFPADASLPMAEAIRSRKPVLLRESADTKGAFVAAPMIVSDRIVGALGLGYRSPRDFDTGEAEFFATVGRECAQALERARLMGELDAEKSRLEEIFTALPAICAMYSGPEHILEFNNPRNVELWGGRNPIGETLRTAYPEVAERALDLWNRVYATGEPLHLTEVAAPVQTGSGGAEERLFNLSLLPRRDASGRIIGVMAFGVDITEQARARQAADEGRRILEALMEHIPEGITIADAPEVNIRMVSRHGVELTGRPRESLERIPAGEHASNWGILRPDGTVPDGEELPLSRAVQRGETVTDEEWLIERPGRERVLILCNAGPIRDGNGRITGGVIAWRDVTALRKLEIATVQQARLIELARDAIIVCDPDRKIVRWNAGARETYGWTEAEALGRFIHELLATQSKVRGPIDDLLQREGRWDGELVHKRRDGRRIVVESSQVLVRNADGSVAGILEVNRDITRRKKAEAALEQSVARFNTLLEGNIIGIVVGNEKWVTEANDAFLRMVGYSREDLRAGKVEWPKMTAPEYAHLDERGVKELIATGASTPFEKEFIRRDGSRVPALVGGSLLRKAPRPEWIAFALDLSERKRLEDRLLQSQRLESIGILAAGVAHRYNNLLTGVIGNLSLVMERLQDIDQQRLLDDALGAADRMAEITRQLLAYSGQGQFVVERANLSRVVAEIEGLLRASCPPEVNLVATLADSVPEIDTDVSQVRQVVINLVTNAIEAVGEQGHGTVLIATRTVTLERPEIESNFPGQAMLPGVYVCLEVRDDGCGMDDSATARLFDPFFSTKFLGRGLGLSAVAGIMRGHRGAVRVESAPGQGSTFSVYFPAART